MGIKYYIKKPLVYIFLFFVLASLFLGAKDQIEWYYQNLLYLYRDVPSDVNIIAVKKIIDLFSGYDVFMSGIGSVTSGFYPIFIMLVIGFLFTGNYAQRLSEGSGILEIIRIGYKKYYLKEIMRNFMATFCFVVLALSIFLLLCICLYSGNPPNKETIIVTDLYYSMPMLYCALQIINQALFLALFSSLCMCTASMYTNTFINRLSPLIIYLFLTVVSQLLYKIFRIPWFVLIFPDLIFVPFNVEGATGVGFIGEKICAYLLLFLSIVVVHCYMYKKYRINYLK